MSVEKAGRREVFLRAGWGIGIAETDLRNISVHWHSGQADVWRW
jgi:hypothetical protein